MDSIVTFWKDVAAISCTHLPIKVMVSEYMDTCGHVPLIVLKMQEQKSLTFH